MRLGPLRAEDGSRSGGSVQMRRTMVAVDFSDCIFPFSSCKFHGAGGAVTTDMFKPERIVSGLSAVCSLLFVLTSWSGERTAGLVSAGARKDTAFTEFFRRSSGWTAGDGALSVPLTDGRVLWLFGDSHVDDVDPATGTMPCLFQTRNAAFLHKTNDLHNVRTLIGRGP